MAVHVHFKWASMILAGRWRTCPKTRSVDASHDSPLLLDGEPGARVAKVKAEGSFCPWPEGSGASSGAMPK